VSTPTPSPSASPSASSGGKAGSKKFVINLPTVPNSGSTNISTVDLSSATFDARGLGLNFPATVDPTKVNGVQLYNAFVKMALSNPQWSAIKYALAQSHFYNTAPSSYAPGWDDGTDGTAIKQFLSTLAHKNSDLGPNETATPIANFLSQTQNMALNYGGASARTQVQKVTIPNTIDLVHIADSAFRSANGRPPTDAQAKAFAKDFQQQVMAVARANVAQTAQIKAPALPASAGSATAFTPKPGAPSIDLSGANPATTPEEALTSIQKNAGKGSTTNTVLQSVQQEPSAQDAALEFARKANPAAAGSENVSNALNAMFASLARNSQ
jgi:hypothetical protein